MYIYIYTHTDLTTFNNQSHWERPRLLAVAAWLLVNSIRTERIQFLGGFLGWFAFPQMCMHWKHAHFYQSISPNLDELISKENVKGCDML